MLSTTNLDIVRRTYDGWMNAGVPADLQAYVRSEYNGDATYVLGEITRAGRVKPATPSAKTGLRALVSRMAARISFARGSKRNPPAEAIG